LFSVYITEETMCLSLGSCLILQMCFRLCSIVYGFTTSIAFREQLEEFFGNLPSKSRMPRSPPLRGRYGKCSNGPLPQRSSAPVSPLTVLELGTHNGATTAALSVIFYRVLAVDNDFNWLNSARKKQDEMGGLPNVVFIPHDLYSDNLRIFNLNQIEVVFIDAAHDYASVKSDSIHALQIKGLQWVVYHDYGLLNDAWGIVNGMQVKHVVDEFVKESFLDCGLGSPPPLARSHSEALPARPGGIGIDQKYGHEGVVCRVLRRWDWTPQSAALALRRLGGNQRSSKLNSQIWYVFAVDSFWIDSILQGSWYEPGAICTISAYSLDAMTIACKGQLINGSGTVSMPIEGTSTLFRRQTWSLTSNTRQSHRTRIDHVDPIRRGSIVDLFMNRQLTSFGGDLKHLEKGILVQPFFQVYGFRSTLCASTYRHEIQSMEALFGVYNG